MSVRQEVHAYIDGIDEERLIALKPLLFTLFRDSIAVETDLTADEIALIDAGLAAHRRGETIRMEDIDWEAMPK